MADSPKVNYDQYFDVDEKYFPCIDDSAIAGGAKWENTYPHTTFIKLLRAIENMLSGSTNRSVWIHGAYGTGKSQCAYALKKILEVPEEELETYWNSYEPLAKEKDLLTKLQGHRDRGIVTVYRYATGGITTPQKFFAAVQESVKKALESNNRISYLGENTLKENVIAWIGDPIHKHFFNELLKKPEWKAKFSQSNAEEVMETLRGSRDVKDLMSNIFELADREGITTMDLDADKLKNWLKDVIERNRVKIVFFWDEFSDFFKNNKYSLGEFQKVVALCQECPFYLVIVTHQAGSIIDEQDESWKIVQQRFDKISITLPDNIAFNLIGHAFKEKTAAKEAWSKHANDLNNRLNDSRRAVMDAAKIQDPKVIKDIMPIHPMAALVLKNIASAFASNQRSMFDFIKVKDDSKAFQYFISNYGPEDDYPLLTIDMLWDFFYEKGKENLTPDIRMILDAYPATKNLGDKEQRVLKTILIMQAIDKRLAGEVDVLKPTAQNINYAFEGITSGLDTAGKHIANQLCNSGILVKTPIGNNKNAFGIAVLAGDQARIDECKKTIRNNLSTARLVTDGGLGNCLSLSPALRLRFSEDKNTEAMVTVTASDFTKTINVLKNRRENWHFNAVIALARDNNESSALRERIKEAVASGDYDNILFIDATASPLGDDNLDSYVEYSAMANYYQGNNNNSSKENEKKAKQVLSDWNNRIYQGPFTILGRDYPEGSQTSGGLEVASILRSVVLKKFSSVLDFKDKLTEAQFKLSNVKNAALCGIKQNTSGVMKDAEKHTLARVWKIENYWERPETSELEISKVKLSIEKLIKGLFEANKHVRIGAIQEHLETEFGYAPSNLTAFLTGFLLKEYSLPKYRYIDDNGATGEMTQEKLAELIGNGIRKQIPAYIVQMNPNEQAFYKTTEIAWSIAPNTLSSPAKASSSLKTSMRNLGFPVWCLGSAQNDDIYDIVEKYISFVQKEGEEAHSIANDIGSEARKNPDLAESLKQFLTAENCRKGMLDFIDSFDNGGLRSLAGKIEASDDEILKDISGLFSVENSSLWNKTTGEDQIRQLIVDYTYVHTTNSILNEGCHSRVEADLKWKEKLRYVRCAREALQKEYPDLKTALEFLEHIYNGEEILPNKMKEYTDSLVSNAPTLKGYLSDEISVFRKIYAPYLEGLSDDDIQQFPPAKLIGIFIKTRTEGNEIVRAIADEYLKNQTKTQLFKFWRNKTDTKSPAEWSERYRTPILAMVPKAEYDSAKKTFEIMNRGTASESEFKEAFDFLRTASLLENLKDRDKIDNAFISLLGTCGKLITDLEKTRDALESLAVDAYDWISHPSVKEKIQEIARDLYDAGGSDKAIQKIKTMPESDLREYLVSLVKKNMELGIGIINGGE